MNYKYTIGQKVLVHVSGKNWDDEYEVPSTIVGWENYVINAVPVYIVKKHYGEVEGGVIESRIKRAEWEPAEYGTIKIKENK